MSYVYTAYYQAIDTDGRFMDFTSAPTITAVDGDGNAIVGSTATNLATGLYKLSVTQNDLEDVIFRIVPHVDDQDDLADCNLLDMRVHHVIDNVQTDLDNPDQYKADVSLLALEATLTEIKGAGWTVETLTALYAILEELLPPDAMVLP